MIPIWLKQMFSGEMWVCSRCGTTNMHYRWFCGNCGKIIDEKDKVIES